MRISKLSKLKDGDTYWYIGVRYQCHWDLYVEKSIYYKNQCWDDQIVFDSEKSARCYLKCLRIIVNLLKIK